jgi:thymidine kinase
VDLSATESLEVPDMMPHAYPVGTGWIEVIAGCMFSGKTEELIRRLNRAKLARQRVLVFKPRIDVRYAEEEVVTHTSERLPCIPVTRASDILHRVGDAQVVGIDEAQFFEQDLLSVCNHLANDGIRVIVAGLDQDFRGEPFEPMPQLLAIAEYITKAHAVCMVCGVPANRSQRLVRRGTKVLLGDQEVYEARCRLHWDPTAFEERQESLPMDIGSPSGSD